MPDVPTPGVKGQSVLLPALHASISIRSFGPATSTFGWLASTAIAGSFCLFRENGVVGLPTLTRVSATKASAASADIRVTAVGIRRGDRTRVCGVRERLVIIIVVRFR